MTYAVIKYSVMEGESTNQTRSFGGQSPVRVTLSDRNEYVWGPNETKTLPDPLGDEAVAADSRLKIVSRS